VAACTADSGRLVSLAIAVTAEARRPVAARGSLVRRVARRAGRVVGNAVEARQRGLGVAGLAGRSPGAATGAVRAMAVRAVERAAVRRLGLGRMAAGAAPGFLPRSMGDVTARAGLVAARRRARLVAVTGRARRGWFARRVACVDVAAGARRVAGALRARHAIRMALAAEGGARDRFRPVRCVARAASGVAGPDRRLRAIGVAASAGRCR